MGDLSLRETVALAKKISERSCKQHFLEEANTVWYLLCEGCFDLDDIGGCGDSVFISFPMKFNYPENPDGSDWYRQTFLDNFVVYTLSDAITDVFRDYETGDLVFQVSLHLLKEKDFDRLVKEKYADALVHLFLKRLKAKVTSLELPLDQIDLGSHLFLNGNIMGLFVQKLREQFSIAVLKIDKDNMVTVQYL